MPLQLGVALRNAMMNVYETTPGTAPKLQIRTGGQPADCAAADSGTLLAEITLPSDWMAAAASGVIAKTGTWTGTASATGTAAHFRLKNNGGTTTHEQGTLTATGGGGDAEIDSLSIVNGGTVVVTAWSRTAPNA